MKMYYLNKNSNHSTLLILPENVLKPSQINQYYFNNIKNPEQVYVLGIPNIKTAIEYKEVCLEIEEIIKDNAFEVLFIADAGLFKYITKETKINLTLGTVIQSKVFSNNLNVISSINYIRLFKNPTLLYDLIRSCDTLNAYLNKSLAVLGSDIIHGITSPDTVEEVLKEFELLIYYPTLAVDIETTSLNPFEAEILSITFCYSQHGGIVFRVGKDRTVSERRTIELALKEFFKNYTGKTIYHNMIYDIKVLIRNLWMKDSIDYSGLINGLHTLTKNTEDTKIICYLVLNTTVPLSLKLKDLAQEFAGNYGLEDIDNASNIPSDKLLKYNLIDGLSTFYLFNKYKKELVTKNLINIYKQLMLPTAKVIIQMELVGMPINMDTVKTIVPEMEQKKIDLDNQIQNNPIVKEFTEILRQEEMQLKHSQWKVKRMPLEYFVYMTFNPDSHPQVNKLIYNYLKLPIINTTETGQPSTKAIHLQTLLNYTQNQEQKDLINALTERSHVIKIISTFIPALQNAHPKPNKHHHLHGSFTMSTKSGRLASNSPNLQAIPSNSVFGKTIKSCFSAPKGFIMAGADFAGLEDMISALTTKDPNKLKVYTDGYDAHSLRAYSYFKDQLPQIENSVTSINSLHKHPLRQTSKPITFALTYAGTHRTLMTNLGLPEAQARAIEENYRTLYRVSIEWTQKRLQEASEKGYVELAFGFQLKTPLLAQSVMTKSALTSDAAAEARTVGNALGQSYGLLNNRAVVAFMQRVWNSPYALCVFPICLIHDAIYLMILAEPDCIRWVNKNLIECMQWQELPELQHPTVKLSAQLELFPTWAKPVPVPVNASLEEISECLRHCTY